MKKTIKVCHGINCSRNFSRYTFERAKNDLKIDNEAGGESQDGNFILEKCGCMGLCEKGPNVKIQDKDAEEIISQCDPIKMAEIIKRLKNKK